MSVTAPQVYSKAAAEKRAQVLSFDGKLESGETITGTPTVVDASDDLTITGAAASTGSLTILGQTVATGRAVQWFVAGGTAGTTYTLVVTAATSEGQTLVGKTTLEVI